MIIFFMLFTSVLLLVITIRESCHMIALHKERLSHEETKAKLRYYLEQKEL